MELCHSPTLLNFGSYFLTVPYLSGWYWLIKQKKGAKKAIIALARKLLVIIYTMLKQGTHFDESCFEARRKNCEQKQISRYVRELQKHGYRVERQQ